MAENVKKKKQPFIAASAKLHALKCSVCKHKDREELEQRYLEGESVYVLEEDFKVRHDTIYKHVKVLGLETKRDNSTITKIRRILERGKLSRIKPSDALIGRCLELEAKITGALVERRIVDIVSKKSDNELFADIRNAEAEAAAIVEEAIGDSAPDGDQIEE